MKTSLDEKESLLLEREESNRLLRKDLLDLMTQFNGEKSALECKLLGLRDELFNEVQRQIALRRQ